MPQLALTLTDSVTRAGDTLGPDHPSTLTSRNNLAGAYQDAGRFDDADSLFKTPSGSEDKQDGTEDNPDQESGD